MARLFFALWPGEDQTGALGALALRLAAETDGRPVPVEKIHMTLAFLGAVADEARPAALAAASNLRATAFELVLDHAGAFRRAGVAWAGTSSPPAELLRLQARLAGRLRVAGFELEDRAFAPHVTLARRTVRAIARRPIEPVAWTARRFTLVRSETGTGRYVIEKEWALRE